MTDINLPPVVDEIHRLIRAGYPIIYLTSWEEKRVSDHMMILASMKMKPARNFFTWSITEGYSDGPKGSGDATGDPIGALDRVINDTEAGLYLIKDFHPYIAERKDVVRRIRDVYQYCRQTDKSVIFLSPVMIVPTELQKEVHVIEYALPGYEELSDVLDEQVQIASMEEAKQYPPVPDEGREQLVKAFAGLTTEEAIHCVRNILLKCGRISYEEVAHVIEEKRQILHKTEILEYIHNDYSIHDLGGLKAFKKWVWMRRKGFSDAARAFGLPVPKGILLTGISGCGKSLAIQCMAAQWKMPMLRLDMGRVFAGVHGTAEEAMRRAIMTVEAIAPAILWIDEIEMGISTFSEGVEAGTASRIFASFLTWMQEKKAPVFTAATANDIDRIPPEMIRKGRFDEVFFVDVPRQAEREEVFRIHLARHGKDITETSVSNLAHHAKGFSGAEIEQIIVAAMYEAFAQDRELTIDDIYHSMGKIVPLTVTMKEQITSTRRWADNRAVKAN